ncbi:hypothetical protein [Asanoa siamensis]|uniref:Peptidase M23 n=1 Tax=Asanoa siamensis TaxID=926357 RepID=A0ABQ4CL40_9ACTN|nr:hypothetical protein Asi02nite_15040 [Asanoa siamensis]
MPPKEIGKHRHDGIRPTSRSVEVTSDGQPAGRHRREIQPQELSKLRTWLQPIFATPAARIGLVAGLACCLGLAAVVETRDANAPARSITSVAAAEQAAAQAAAERSLAETQQRASRANDRTALIPESSPTPTPTASTPAPPAPTKTTPTRKPTPRNTATKKPTPTKAATTSKPKPTSTVVAPVAGLTQAQMNNAATIVRTGVKMGIPERGLIVAIATSMQESRLLNLANTGLPESLNYPNEGTGYDHDSVGLFQQRTSTGWGTVQELMTPSVSASKFFAALQQVLGWQNMSIAGAAQAVQVSAFPDAYAQHEGVATTVVEALT